MSSIFLRRDTLEEILTRQNGGPYGLGAAVAGDGASLVLTKRGQNVGYQGYLILYPATGQGLVVMTNSDNGSKLAEAVIRRAAEVYGWPELPPLAERLPRTPLPPAPRFLCCELAGEPLLAGRKLEKRSIASLDAEFESSDAILHGRGKGGERLEATLAVPGEDDFGIVLHLAGGPDFGKVAVWLRLGAVLARQERWSEARDAFAKARALDPKAPLDPQLLAFIEQKAAADSQGSGGLGGGSPPR